MRSCPPPGPELHFPVGGGGALVREGGLCAMLEKPEFVPMARPYASDIPIYLYTYVFLPSFQSRVTFARRPPRPDTTNERARPVCTGARCGRISGIRSFPEHVWKLPGPKAIHLEAACASIWKSLGSPLESSWKSTWGRARGTKSTLRKPCPLAPLPGQSSTSHLGEAELWFGRGASCNAREAEIRTYGSSVCF